MSNGKTANTGIVWATVPLQGDANKFVVEGILRAYDASNPDPIANADELQDSSFFGIANTFLEMFLTSANSARQS